ncbi:universal stress protein [Pseudoduganella sp. GCM10020061]|uniref:universal stress protein n=1 Tax=Pseudoduganella sp. GCM10020061 TaxID=3317345 RepID=UPI0036382FE6
MSYKTILVHVDGSRHAQARIELAANLAYACKAHLVGASMTGLARFVYPDPSMPLAVDLIATQVELMNERAEAAIARFDEIVRRTGIETYEHRKVEDEPDTALAMQARYADLVVVSQSDPSDPGTRLVSALPEYVMLNSARPMLVVPHASPPAEIGRHALVGWNGSAEAVRAITGAIPLLQRSRQVTVAVFNPGESYGIHGEVPGADIATWLSRHGVKVQVMAQETQLDIGNSLLSMAADLDCDLLVMGGYGRPRYRELLLGGVTRTVLETTHVPVLIAH